MTKRDLFTAHPDYGGSTEALGKVLSELRKRRRCRVCRRTFTPRPQALKTKNEGHHCGQRCVVRALADRRRRPRGLKGAQPRRVNWETKAKGIKAEYRARNLARRGPM